METRLTEAHEKMVAQAAEYQGVSQTDSVLIIKLSLEQSKKIAAVMIDPPAPNDAFRETFAEHRKKIAS